MPFQIDVAGLPSRGLSRLALVLIALTALLPKAHASDNRDFCIAGVRSAGDGKLGYANRGDRCEGLYLTGYSSAPKVDILGFRKLLPVSSAPALGDPQLIWAVPPDAADDPLRITVLSLDPDVNYRLDTRVGTGQQRFTWPGRILGSLDILQSGLSVVATRVAYFHMAGGRKFPKRVYVPVGQVIAADGQQTVTASTITMVPTQTLRSYSWRIYPVTADINGTHADPGADLLVRKPLRSGVQVGIRRRGKPFDIPISGDIPPGYYEVHLTFTPARSAGQPAPTKTLTFWHWK